MASTDLRNLGALASVLHHTRGCITDHICAQFVKRQMAWWWWQKAKVVQQNVRTRVSSAEGQPMAIRKRPWVVMTRVACDEDPRNRFDCCVAWSAPSRPSLHTIDNSVAVVVVVVPTTTTFATFVPNFLLRQDICPQKASFVLSFPLHSPTESYKRVGRGVRGSRGCADGADRVTQVRCPVDCFASRSPGYRSLSLSLLYTFGDRAWRTRGGGGVHNVSAKKQPRHQQHVARASEP